MIPMDVNELKRRACEAVDRNAEKIIAVGESIFAEPELGYKEFKTSAKVKKVLDELGIAHQDDVAITGVIAPMKGRNSNVKLALMGELDAIVAPGHRCADPVTGAAHSCGHHVQIATVMGAAMALKDSGIMAFFTRSSAANIPVNMKLCEDLGLDKEKYSVSIPLGATINMAGAAITITILTLAAANTLGISVDFPTALLLSLVSSVAACGSSGVAGGSLLLIPMACSMFGISSDIAMQVVGIGFIIGVIQDSCETALNSSSDVLFTAAAEFLGRRKDGLDMGY